MAKTRNVNTIHWGPKDVQAAKDENGITRLYVYPPLSLVATPTHFGETLPQFLVPEDLVNPEEHESLLLELTED